MMMHVLCSMKILGDHMIQKEASNPESQSTVSGSNYLILKPATEVLETVDTGAGVGFSKTIFMHESSNGEPPPIRTQIFQTSFPAQK